MGVYCSVCLDACFGIPKKWSPTPVECRHHAVFTNSTEPMLLAEAHHRDHAIVEQGSHRRSEKLSHGTFSSSPMDADAAWLTVDRN